MNRQELCSKVERWMRAHEAQIVRELKSLVDIPSTKAPSLEGAPFGEACAEALEASAKLLEAHGCRVERYPHSGYALGFVGEGKSTIALFAHTDVVPARAEEWRLAQPYDMQVIDGHAVGRGVCDNKNAVVMSACIASMVREWALPLHSRLEIILGSSEEDGMPDSKAFAREQPMPDLTLVPDSSFPVCAGEKGLLKFIFRSGVPFRQIVRFQGGKVLNIVLDQVDVALRYSPELERELHMAIEASGQKAHLGREGELLTLDVRGIPSHSSRPEHSLNAGGVAASLLLQCPSLDREDAEQLKVIAHVLGHPFGEAMGIGGVDPDFGPTTTVNGIVRAKDGYPELSLDIRYGSWFDDEGIERTVKDFFARRGWTAVYKDHLPGYNHGLNGRMTRLLCDVYRDVSGDQKAEPYFTGGATYARDLRNAYTVGDTAPYLPQTLVDEVGYGSAHQADECLRIEALFEATKIILCMILEADQALSDPS